MLTPAWTQLRPHPVQSALWRCSKRFVAVPAGRGSGKSELARRRVVRLLPVKRPWPDPLFFYALPTYSQAKRTAWKQILRLIPPSWIRGQPNHSELFVETVFGSTLYLLGMDRPHRAEGVQWDGGIFDESCDQKPEAFTLSILPALAHRNGWCWRIGVPKRFGVGAEDFRQFSKRGEEGKDPDLTTFTWTSESVLKPEQLQWAKENCDARDYAEQYLASWERAGGAVFYSFDDESNIHPVDYYAHLPLVVGSDFNVNPMCWCIGHIIEGQLHIFDELYIRDTNTTATLTELHRRYGQHTAGWEFYGDASGRARKTAGASAAAQSDYLIIRNDARFAGARVYYPQSNPARVDRFAACNAMFCNALGERRLFIHPRCSHLRRDLLSRTWKEGTREPDDYGDVGHMSDALGYIVHRRFPYRLSGNSGGQEVGFS